MSSWPTVKLDDVARRGSGHTPSKQHPEYWDGSIKWVSLRDTSRLDRGVISETAACITPAGLAHSSAVVHPAGSVVLLRDAGIGKSGVLGSDMAVSQHFMAWSCGPSLDNWFLYYILQSRKPEFERISNGSTIKTIGLDYFRRMEVPLPDLNEQKEIAETLTDIDNLITTLVRQMNKRQAIKQGTMQQLLTGRTRLPGFSDDWKPVRLRDAGVTYGGLVGKNKSDFGTGSGSFVTFMEVMAGARLLGLRLERVRVRSGERQNQVRRGDVLFNGSSETPEEVALAAVVEFDPVPGTYLNSFCFGYRVTDPLLIDPTYLAYFSRSGEGRTLVASLAQGATRYNIAKSKMLELSVLLPPVAEQRAIVAVLRDLEASISCLQRRLAKVLAIKSGMMQQLMTGRTRLRVEAAS
jgi:type I restriction enzyme S subunit